MQHSVKDLCAWPSTQASSGVWIAKRETNTGDIYRPKVFTNKPLLSSRSVFLWTPFWIRDSRTALIRLSHDHGTCTEIGRYSRVRKCGGVRYANGDFGDGVFVTAEGAVVSLVDGQVINHLPFPVTIESRPSAPEEAGLGRHGYGIEQMKNWRQRENKAGRASGLEDFYRAFHICFPCRGLGKLVIGVRWRDETETNGQKQVPWTLSYPVTA